MENQDKDNGLVTVRVASKEQLLAAGYVPEGRNLRGKDNSLIEAAFLQQYAGKMQTGRVTESKEYPVIVDDHILPAAAVHLEQSRVKIQGVEHIGFSDGSVTVGGTHYSVKEAAKAAAIFNQKAVK